MEFYLYVLLLPSSTVFQLALVVGRIDSVSHHRKALFVSNNGSKNFNGLFTIYSYLSPQKKVQLNNVRRLSYILYFSQINLRHEVFVNTYSSSQVLSKTK